MEERDSLLECQALVDHQSISQDPQELAGMEMRLVEPPLRRVASHPNPHRPPSILLHQPLSCGPRPPTTSSCRRARDSSLRVSMDDPGILMVNTSAHRLGPQYKYHAFLLYHSSDRQWVLGLVRRLEAAPYHFKCAYDLRDFYRNTSELQNIVCAMMLSERVILVVSEAFLAEVWTRHETTLSHMTSLTQRKQRVIPLVLPCLSSPLPENLRSLPGIQTNDAMFWEQLLLALRHEMLPTSASCATMCSMVSQSTPYSNGQLVCSVQVKVTGVFRPSLSLELTTRPWGNGPADSTDESELITPNDVEMLLDALGLDERALPWQFTAAPSIMLSGLAMLWCIGLVLVIFVFPESSPATLPVRLCVFLMPAVLLVSLGILRWHHLNGLKENKAKEVFKKTTHVNVDLFNDGKPLILTSIRNKKTDTINIYILFYSVNECLERLRLVLNYCNASDRLKLTQLISLSNQLTSYIDSSCLESQLAFSMASAYASQIVSRTSPHPLEQRHTRRRQCLCQFTEDFLSAYLPLARSETPKWEVGPLRALFTRHLQWSGLEELSGDQELVEKLGLEAGVVLPTITSVQDTSKREDPVAAAFAGP